MDNNGQQSAVMPFLPTNTGSGLVWPLYRDAGHLKHPPCAHRQAEHGALPLEGHGGGVEDVPDEPRGGVPHPQDVPGEQMILYVRYKIVCNLKTFFLSFYGRLPSFSP